MGCESSPLPATKPRFGRGKGNFTNPSAMTLASAGTPVWWTTWNNFAPRAGVALSDIATQGTGTWWRAADSAVFYDPGNEQGW